MNHTPGADLKRIKALAAEHRIVLTPELGNDRTILLSDRFGEALGEMRFHRGVIVEAYLGPDRLTTESESPTPVVTVLEKRLAAHPTAIARRKATAGK